MPFLVLFVFVNKLCKLDCKKKSVQFTVKYRQLWLPECYREKYGSNILGFTELFKFTVKTHISLTKTMLIYNLFSWLILFAETDCT